MTEVEFRNILRRNGLPADGIAWDYLINYSSKLLEWNKRVNLISRSDPNGAHFIHILHSISLLFFVYVPRSLNILDLGTGGGLPGIPIGIVRPDLRITLVDSIRKKSAAVADMIAGLGLTNLSAVNSRAEDLKTRDFNIILARAVAPLDELIRWSRPLVARSGQTADAPANTALRTFRQPFLVTWKGGDLTDEIARARTKHPKSGISTINLVFPGSVEAALEDKKLVIVEL